MHVVLRTLHALLLTNLACSMRCLFAQIAEQYDYEAKQNCMDLHRKDIMSMRSKTFMF